MSEAKEAKAQLRHRVYFCVKPGEEMKHNSTWADRINAKIRARELENKGYGTEIVSYDANFPETAPASRLHAREEPEGWMCGSTKAPSGWGCTREKGHDGSCAARVVTKPSEDLSRVSRDGGVEATSKFWARCSYCERKWNAASDAEVCAVCETEANVVFTPTSDEPSPTPTAWCEKCQKWTEVQMRDSMPFCLTCEPKSAAPSPIPSATDDEENIDPAIRLLADVMHLWTDGYISKNPSSMAPDSISNASFEAIASLLKTHEITVDYCGWHVERTPESPQLLDQGGSVGEVKLPELDEIGRRCILERDTFRKLTETSEDFAGRMRRLVISERDAALKENPELRATNAEQYIREAQIAMQQARRAETAEASLVRKDLRIEQLLAEIDQLTRQYSHLLKLRSDSESTIALRDTEIARLKEEVSIMHGALDYMNQYNGRSNAECIRMARADHESDAELARLRGDH